MGKKFLKGLIFLLLGVGVYVIGCFFPIKAFVPIVANEFPVVTRAEWLSHWQSGIYNLLTFFTIIIALFKESWLRYIFKPKFSINNDEKDIPLRVLHDDDLTGETDDETASVPIQYYSILYIKNIGNTEATHCQVKIKKIEYKAVDDTPVRLVSSKIMQLNRNNEFLSENDEYSLKLFSLSCMEPGGNKPKSIPPVMETNGEGDDSESTESSSSTSSAGTLSKNLKSYILKIGRFTMPTNFINGYIYVYITISAQNGYFETKKIQLHWDNKWGADLEKMKNHLQVKII